MNKKIRLRKFLISGFILVILSVSFQSLMAQPKTQLEFRKDKTFSIAQFTDLHVNIHSPKLSLTLGTIKNVLETEKPDLAILTGDVVVAVPAKDGWLALAKVFENAKTPWAVTLGNHDGEPGITRDQVFELLVTLPWFVGTKGPELSGCGNYALPVKAYDGKAIAAVIYCIDSNDYPKDRKISNYDWIKFDQVAWYRSTSDQFKASNNGLQVPSLAFFHIPLIEYKDMAAKGNLVGENKEAVSTSDLNSGLFASMVEKMDIMGVFVGHSHNDNYIGIEHNIALAFGEVTGADGYGQLERGSRIIELHEGKFSFDTWIRTKSGTQFKFNYPNPPLPTK
ncbi:MAG: metallophosphoesterase family protein [Mariniphaga sp.]